MKQRATKTILTGLMGWVFLFVIIGGVTGSSDLAVRVTGAIICPDDTTAGTTTYTVMATGSNGVTTPSRQYILQCKDASGTVVLENDTNFMFLWAGILAGLGFILALPVSVVALLVVWMRKTK